ncbi:MAG: flavin reductase family protein [Candidatus Cloacimonetes bacterium]|nr:flavin reductase family protein [Candidatus Cloacimonadota bacterium]
MQRAEFTEVWKSTKKLNKVVLAIMPTPVGKYNLITLEWFMRTSIKPPMLAISIGHTRFSYECLQVGDCFNVCYPSGEMTEAVKICGTQSGRDMDKLLEIKEDWFHGRYRKVPILKNAVANFECQLVSQIRSGDHTIFIGEVKYSWVNTEKELLFL